MKITIEDQFLNQIIHILAIMAVIAAGFYVAGLLKGFLWAVQSVFTPFVIALLMAYILAPIVVGLQRRLKLGRIMGTLVLYFIIILVFFLFMAFLIPKLLSELIRLFETLKIFLPALIVKLSHSDYLNIDPNFTNMILEQIKNIQVDYQKIFAAILPGIKSIAFGGVSAIGKATKGLFSSISFLVGLASFMVLVGIINFYFIVDWEKLRPLIHKMVPAKQRERTFEVLDKMDAAVGGFLRGQLTVSAIVGFIFTIGLFSISFMGFSGLRNYCLLIGTTAAIGGFIPYLGPVIGVTPALLIVLVSGGASWSSKFITITAVLILFALIQAIEGFVLQPKIVGKGAGLHPLVVMLALVCGAQLGIGGMIMAIPIASILRVLVLEFYRNNLSEI